LLFLPIAIGRATESYPNYFRYSSR